MATLSPAQQSRTLAEFKHLLANEWTRPVACQDHCHDVKGRCPDCQFVHVAALEAWWKRKASESTYQRKVDRLFDEMQLGERGQLHSDPQRYSTACIRVLSLLLEHDLGHLIKRFYDSNMHDKYLQRGEGYRDLRLHLQKSVPPGEADHILQIFHKARWAYCPLELYLHMDHNLQGTKVILPFCRKVRLGEGGTASVYWVAVEKDLIRDDALRSALKESLIVDHEFGECYQMALKSYRGNKEPVFDLERNAFSGLNLNSQVPIVRYLGCYAHDLGEGSTTSSDPNMRKTYNLLLEYGEQDLYEYWADETNIPPVRAEEIICYWESLFEIAKAIRHVHNLEIPREKAPPRKFHGWHADIKPDNILIVHGQFKLADFGYSKFAPVTDSKRVPTEYIDGFTDSYGAPEVSRAKRPDGTVSEVTQSIDTWSFGCVLSVAATWVVLGFQGVRQYEKLRKLSATNNKDGKTYDRFHDGVEALPEIRRWHDYLRGHLRRSDTMTPHVLRLVENNMLQTDVRDRSQMTGLCQELERLVRMAKTEIDNLDEYAKDTDKRVLRALLEVEEDAHREQSSKPKSIPSHPSPSASNQKDTLKPLQTTSKIDRLKSIPLGHTTYRKPIILNELQSNIVITKDNERNTGGTHEGATTESPVDEHPIDRFPSSSRGTKPRNPQVQVSEPRQSVYPTVTPEIPRQTNTLHQPTHAARGRVEHPAYLSNSVTVAAYNVTQHHSGEAPDPSEGQSHSAQLQRNAAKHQEFTQRNQKQYIPNASSGYEQRAPGPSPSPIQTQHGPIRQDLNTKLGVTTPAQGLVSSRHRGWDDHNAHLQRAHGPHPPSSRFSNGHQNMSGHSGRYFSEHPSRGAEPATAPHQTSQVSDQDVPWIDNPSPLNAAFVNDHAHQLNGAGSFQDSPHSPRPDITITQPVEIGSGSPAALKRASSYGGEKEAFVHQSTQGAEKVDALPSSVYELPYDVCNVRRELITEDPKGVRASVKEFFGKEKRTADKGLAKTYGGGREIIFVVDNGATMFEHWPILVFVAETLAKRAAGLDKTGIDLIFTVGGREFNQTRLKGDQGRLEFRQALERAEPDTLDNFDNQTDLYATLEKIIAAWKKDGRPPTTLLILTDGIWKSTIPNNVDNIILNVAQNLSTTSNNSSVGKRPFGIQFIRFGESGKQKLEMLDNELCRRRDLRDIVDHCSWRSTVEKMFKGSIEGQMDQQDPEERDITCSYTELVALFRRFNDGMDNGESVSHSGLLAPASDHLTPSRSSSSASASRWRASAPLEKRNDQRRESWQSHSRQPMSM